MLFPYVFFCAAIYGWHEAMEDLTNTWLETYLQLRD